MESGEDIIAKGGAKGDDSWTLTGSGRKVVFLNPQVNQFCLTDIAKHTSMICRFTGGTSQFYSVAQHAVFVGLLVKERLDNDEVELDKPEYWDQILAALLHDAEEAYVQDLSSPLKEIIRGRYNWVATGIRRKIFELYEVEWGYYNQIVKDADVKAVIVERFHLMPHHHQWPKLSPSEMDYPCPPEMSPAVAEQNFTEVFQFTLKMRNTCR